MNRHLGLLAALSLTFVAGAARANKPKCPNIVIVLDRSGSMAQTANGHDVDTCSRNSQCSSNRCYTAYGSCDDPSAKISIAHSVIEQVLLGGSGVAAPNPSLRFGFTYFPNDESGQCTPAASGPLAVPCDYDTNQSIVNKVNSLGPNGGTPTAESLAALAGDPAMTDASRARYVVFVTDGQPGCTGGDPEGPSVNAVASLHHQGVRTFVVGFGSAVSGSATLNDMAAQGQDPYPDGGTPAAFAANSPTDLANALSSVIQRASGELGQGGCDDTCLGQGCPDGQRCDTSGATPACVVDPCSPSPCQPSEFCRVDNGSAICSAGCPQGCPNGTACIDTQCLPDNCALGTCQTCPAGQTPDPSGTCVTNQCLNIHCPNSAPYCHYNNCSGFYAQGTTTGSTGASGASNGSSGTTGTKANGNVSSSGCSCQSTSPDALALSLLALGALAFRKRKVI